MSRINIFFEVLKNMGIRYFFFRSYHQFIKKIGIFRLRFPVNPKDIDVISLQEWRSIAPQFFFEGKEINGLPRLKSARLQKFFDEYSEGVFTFFEKTKYHLGTDYDWITNPESRHKYNINQHWTLINDMSGEEGDIKLVWEKARFNFILDLIRYDYHHETDCAHLVFSEINSFIDKNPINQGPNYVCSQEISLRVLNWTIALYYYKDSVSLTDELFRKILNSIYWQIHHVFKNINFSRITVRNNHALTETLLLYVSGILFPFLPGIKKWSASGKKWFEQEVNYQIYSDGTYLQFSNNYHRVVMQLLTFGIQLAKLNGEKFNKDVYSRSKKSLEFLYNSMDLSSGMLPNYGANDGALFFKFNDQDFRDFRPQLQALGKAMDINPDLINFDGEDLFWFGLDTGKPKPDLVQNDGAYAYPEGGFYLIRDAKSLTFLRCGNHKDRPGSADNLHIDIWYNGKNYFRDNGSYSYNTDSETLRYFMGTRSHNTVMLDDYDQMLKGPRFIWLNWTQSLEAHCTDSDSEYRFDGTISAFRHVDKSIKHRRIIRKIKGFTKWIVIDEISGNSKYAINQIWHFDPQLENNITITAKDNTGKNLYKQEHSGWFSSYYGFKEAGKFCIFSTNQSSLLTEISITE